ncbi:hypothetical protein [Protofrankia sp. BMG5.30]|uniref:hypothetical protein n=2 Tax=Protofrankia TaxID=2994361 RepID=UPI00097754EF|nr:hypothetical protein [Protofrankia sp. BMG5.30]ONH34499.1 hypothetical protein BL254_15715 [Protofrankia sp. BMG5.30]
MTDPTTGADLDALARSTASGLDHGVTAAGFVPKPVGRILDEKIALARALFGADVDLTSGSVLRTLLELVSVEDARMWSHLGLVFDDSFVSTATGEALSRLGAELGLTRPFHRATGTVRLALAGDLPPEVPQLTLPRGSRLRSRGGTSVFLADPVRLDGVTRSVTAAVTAFEPGPGGDLDPAAQVDGDTPGRIDAFDPADARTSGAAALVTAGTLTITHGEKLEGGSLTWSDETYRDLLLAYPRTLWTPDALRVAVSLVPGVRQVLVRDLYGGLDVNQSIYGNFSFAERLFSEQRSLGNPYYVTVLVAPDESAVWDGPGQLADRVRQAVDTVRPIGIAPSIEQALQVGVGLRVRLSLDGLAASDTGTSAGTTALVGRIVDRIRRYVGRLRIGEPVRYSEAMWAVMNEPGVADARDLRLLRYPPRLTDAVLGAGQPYGVQEFGVGEDVTIGPAEVPVLVTDPSDVVVA